MTNGDRIRNMTDEELALFAVSGGLFPCNHCKYKENFACNRVFCDMCRPQLACSALEIWLQEETDFKSEKEVEKDMESSERAKTNGELWEEWDAEKRVANVIFSINVLIVAVVFYIIVFKLL